MRSINDRDTFDLSGFKKANFDGTEAESTTERESAKGRPTLPSMADIQDTDPPTKFSCLMSSITSDDNNVNTLGTSNSRGGNSSTSSLLSERLNGYKSLYNTNLSLAIPSINTTTTTAATVAVSSSTTPPGSSPTSLSSMLQRNSQEKPPSTILQQQPNNSFSPLFQSNQSINTQSQSISEAITPKTQQKQGNNDIFQEIAPQSPSQHQQSSSPSSKMSAESLLLLQSQQLSSRKQRPSSGQKVFPVPQPSQPLSQHPTPQMMPLTPEMDDNNNNNSSNNDININNNTMESVGIEEKLQGLWTRQNVAMMYSSALQGNIAVQALPLAQILISTQKIFKFRTFAVGLELSEAYMQKNLLTDDDILKAGLDSKCYKEGDLSTPLNSCQACCPRKKIIELGISNKQTFVPKRTPYGTLIYTFDTCKTNCSSSRDHHKSNLVIGIDSLPDAGIVTSLPFVIQAREKQQGIRRGKNTVSSGTVLPSSVLTHASIAGGGLAPQQLLLSPSTTTTTPSSSSSSQGVITNDIIKQNQGQNILLPSFMINALPHQSQSLLNNNNNSIQQERGQFVSSTITCSSRQKLDDLSKVNVFVLSSTLGSEENDRLLQDMRLYIQKLEGFLQLKYCISGNIIIVFSFFESETQHKTAESLIRNYLKNDGENKNLYNINLIENGVISIITVCPSW